MIMNKNLTSKDLCLYRGIPGIAILAISLLVAVRIGCDFGRDGFIQTVVFLGCNLALWTLFLTVFQFLPSDVLALWMKKANSSARPASYKEIHEAQLLLPCIKEAENGNDTDDDVVEEIVEEEPESGDADETQDSVPVSQTQAYTFSSEKFSALNREHLLKREAERQHLHTIILEYAGITMSPYLSEQALSTILDEIQMWMNDCTHMPQPIALRVRLTTLDLQHFIWNIGKRLGARNGYNGTCMANFIKAMFPDIFKDKEIESVKNLTFNPDKGSIRIDRPSGDDNDIEFHYQQQESTEKSA